MADRLARIVEENDFDKRLANEVQAMYGKLEKYRAEVRPHMNDLRMRIHMHRTSPSYSTTRPSDEIRPAGKLLEMRR
jgi:hypothetical protein